MSVYTTADERIDRLKESVAETTKLACQAYIDISVVGEIWGASDYNPDFHARLRRVNELMIEAKELMR